MYTKMYIHTHVYTYVCAPLKTRRAHLKYCGDYRASRARAIYFSTHMIFPQPGSALGFLQSGINIGHADLLVLGEPVTPTPREHIGVI